MSQIEDAESAESTHYSPTIGAVVSSSNIATEVETTLLNAYASLLAGD
jgi:hypothetical protein